MARKNEPEAPAPPAEPLGPTFAFSSAASIATNLTEESLDKIGDRLRESLAGKLVMPAWLAVLLALFLGLVICDSAAFVYNAGVKSVNPEIERAKVESIARAKELDFKLKADEERHQLEVKAANACLNWGRTPLFHDGNVDCK